MPFAGGQAYNMKKILFVDKSFAVGGIQTSMINMMNSLVDEYDVSLFVYNPEGPLKNRLSPKIKVIDPSWRVQTLGMSFSECLKHGTLRQKMFRITMTVWAKIFDNRFPLIIAFSHQPNLKEYDYAIAFHHEAEKKAMTSGFIRFIKKCVIANTYVSWVHNDANNNPIDENFNDKYYRQVDKIVCVSESVKNSFIQNHSKIPEEKVKVCHNFLDFLNINSMAEEKPTIHFDKTKFSCFSACRLERVKGFPRAIEAIAETLKKYDIQWYIAGSGSERGLIEEAITKYGLEKNIHLLGTVSNPYPLIKQADLLILSSYFEAAPMLYSEAKFFKKPVFTTEISSSKEMLDNGAYGIICENSINGIRIAFANIFKDDSILAKINMNLKQVDYNKDSFLESFEHIL